MRSITHQILLGALALVLLLTTAMAMQADEGNASAKAVADALKEGHWDEALKLSRLRLDAGDGTPSDVSAVTQSVVRLNRVDEFDPFIERVTAQYANDPAMLLAAAEAYQSVPKYGFLVAGEFRRGRQRGRGEIVSVEEADRIRALRLGVAAMEQETGDAELFRSIGRLLADELMSGRGGRMSWRLQQLTDLDGELPDPTEGYRNQVPQSDSPVVADGDMPVLYEVPESWEAAKNDGERWRWALAEVAQRVPSAEKESDLRYARFLQQQFGVQSLVQQGWFREVASDAQADETSALAVETLDDDETIARLATGVRRFTLPEGHRFIELFRKHDEWSTLARTYLDRNQRVKAVEATQKWLAATKDKESRKRIQQGLDQLLKPWVRFETVTPQAAGSGATVRVTHRNAGKVEFVAKQINVEKLLADVRAVIKDPPAETPHYLLQVEQLGYRLVQENQEKYLGEEVASWSIDLEVPADHRDAQQAITTPLQKAGAYFITAKPSNDEEKGAESNVVVWVANTVLVRKPTEKGALYQLLDAVTGKPIDGATIDLFGYRQVYEDEKGKRFQKPRMETTREAGGTDQAGIATFDLAPRDERGYEWLAVATTKGGRLAHLGFDGVWRQIRDNDPPENARTFVVTDRPVYRPEDKVEFKLWIGKPNYAAAARSEGNTEAAPSPYAHQEFKVDLYDARGEKVDSQRLTADAYGGIEGSYVLPTAAALGAYRIDLVGFGGGTFRVEEYRKPEFEVTVEAPEEPTKLGEPIEATINATYYAGTPVRDGTLSYKVTRTTKRSHWLPPRPWDWLYGSGYGWLGQPATWRSDWRAWGCFGPWPDWNNEPPEVVAEGEAMLDDDGKYRLKIETTTAASQHPDNDHEYQISATVTDAGRRTITGSGQVLAARKPVEVTVWLNQGFYDVDATVRANVSARRPDGKPVASAGELRLLKIAPPIKDQPKGDEGEPVKLVDPEETLVQTWSLATNADGIAEMRLKASEPGRYRLVYKSQSTAKDKNGEAVEAVEGGMIFTIRGPGFDGSGFRFGDLELIPNQAEYAPGDKVRLMVNTDHADSTVTLFIRPVGGVYDKPTVLRLSGKSNVVDIPVEPGDMPNFFVEAHTIANGKLHTVQREIIVPPESRVITVDAEPSATSYLPGEKGSLRVRLTDADGKPIVGQATIAVYDRSVEAIAGGPSGGDIRERFWDWKRTHSPSVDHNLMRTEGPVVEEDVPVMESLGIFGNIVPRRRGGSIGMMFSRGPESGGVALASDMAMTAAPRAEAAMEKSDGSDSAPAEESSVAVRENFADTALWVGAVETDKDGFANVEMPLPESLTAWKVRVWSVAPGLRVGQGEAEVVTRKDLMVRLRVPRFLVDGDEATFAALVQNESPRELTVDVRLESEGDTLTTPSPASQQVVIPAGSEKLVNWQVTAKAEGEAIVRAIAQVKGEAKLSDAMQIKLPVLVHGAERVESFSAVIAPDERLTTFELVVPAERRPEATRLEVRYSPTLVGAMLDTLPYLIEYPHGCTEQTLNRFLPVAIVRQTIQDLGVDLAKLKPTDKHEGPPERPNPVFNEAELDKIVAIGVRRLMEMQLSDGGWGWFSGFGERSTPHTTAVVVRGLRVARASGVAVPDDVLQQGIEWLKRYRTEQLAKLANGDEQGERIDEDKPWKPYADNLDALVELTLSENDAASPKMLRRLYDDRLKLTTYSMAMLGVALHAEGSEKSIEQRDGVIRNLRQFVETDDENQTAWLNLPDGGWWYWYGSEYEAQAYFLKLLSITEPNGELAPKLVKYLLANRRHATRWNSTRDTALVVEAMADYVKASGEATAEGTVEVWLDGKQRDTKSFDATTALRFDGRFVLEGSELATGRHTLELRRQGEGRLYAGASLTNFSLEDDIRAAGLEVRVKRRLQKLVPIEAKGDSVDARGGVLAPQVEKYRRIDVPNLGEVDSGDLVEVELTITSKNDYEYLILEDPKPAGFEPVEVRSGYNGNAIGAYVEFRDEQVLFYARTLARGERTVTYRLRAETPGKFSALPTQIRGMYAPELRGNSDEIKVVVEDAN